MDPLRQTLCFCESVLSVGVGKDAALCVRVGGLGLDDLDFRLWLCKFDVVIACVNISVVKVVCVCVFSEAHGCKDLAEVVKVVSAKVGQDAFAAGHIRACCCERCVFAHARKLGEAVYSCGQHGQLDVDA